MRFVFLAGFARKRAKCHYYGKYLDEIEWSRDCPISGPPLDPPVLFSYAEKVMEDAKITLNKNKSCCVVWCLSLSSINTFQFMALWLLHRKGQNQYFTVLRLCI